MRRLWLGVVLAAGIAMLASVGFAQHDQTAGPYKVLKTVKVGGDGGFDYVYADSVGRRLYVPRSGPKARITVFDLDTLEPAGEVPNVNGHGAVVDPKTNHGFVTSNPVVMSSTQKLLRSSRPSRYRVTRTAFCSTRLTSGFTISATPRRTQL